MEKLCKHCNTVKSLSEFHKQKDGRWGVGSRCKPCAKAATVKWQKENPERYKAHWERNNLLRKCASYNLTEEEIKTLLGGQKCQICGKVPENFLHIDHDHLTGKVRGVLCPGCNLGIGYFKDDPQVLRAAAKYLETHLTKLADDENI